MLKHPDQHYLNTDRQRGFVAIIKYKLSFDLKKHRKSVKPRENICIYILTPKFSGRGTHVYIYNTFYF